MDFKTIKSQLWKEHLDEIQKLASFPTLLPEYQKEYLSFVHKRTDMIGKLGGNSETYDFKTEFDNIWRSKFSRIMNAKFEKKVKLAKKFFNDGSHSNITDVIIRKVYQEIDKPYRSVSPASSDSSSRAGLYRSSTSKRYHSYYKSASASTSHKRRSYTSRSSSSDVSVTRESMKNSSNIQSQSAKDRSYYKISPESKCSYQPKSGSKDRFSTVKKNSSDSRSRSRSSSRKKTAKRKHKKRKSKDHSEVKKYKGNKRRSASSSRSKSTSYSLREPRDSFSESSNSSISTNSSSSFNSSRRENLHHHYKSSKNSKSKKKYSRSQAHKRCKSKSPLYNTKDAGHHVESLPIQSSCFSSSGDINRTQTKPLNKLFSTFNNESIRPGSLEFSKEEIKKFLQNISDLKDEPSPSVEHDQLSPSKPLDITSTFSKHHFNQYLKSCAANIELKESGLVSCPTLSLKDEINLFISNAVIEENIRSLKEKEMVTHVNECFSPNEGETKGRDVVKKENLPKEIRDLSTVSVRDDAAQIVNPVVVCIDCDDEKIAVKESIKNNGENSLFSFNENLKRTISSVKSGQMSTAAAHEGILEPLDSGNIFFSVYRDTLVYLKSHEELLGMYASVIGPLLLDLCFTYGSKLTMDHQIALTLILDMLRLSMCTKPLSCTAIQDHKEAISKIENVMLHYAVEEADSYPSFLYGYDVNDLAYKMLKKNSVETKKFISCLLLHDGFEDIDSEPFTNLYKQVEIKKEKMNRMCSDSRI